MLRAVEQDARYQVAPEGAGGQWASLGVEGQLRGTETGAGGNRSCSPDPGLGVAVEGFPSPLLSVRPGWLRFCRRAGAQPAAQPEAVLGSRVLP